MDYIQLEKDNKGGIVMFKRKFKRLFAFLMIFSVMCCGFPAYSIQTDVQASSAIVLNKKKVTLKVGKTYQLKVSGTKKTVKWSSKNKKIATVSKKGKITAKKAGKTTIIAKINSKTLKCKVIVKKNRKATANKNGRTVYVTMTGKRYHYDNHCNGGTYYESTLEEAKRSGLTPCQKCVN